MLFFLSPVYAQDELSIQQYRPPTEKPNQPDPWRPTSCADNPSQKMCQRTPEDILAKPEPKAEPFRQYQCGNDRLNAMYPMTTKLNIDGNNFKSGSFEIWAAVNGEDGIVIYPEESFRNVYCVLVPTKYVGYDSQWTITVVADGVTKWIAPDFGVSDVPVTYYSKDDTQAQNLLILPEVIIQELGIPALKATFFLSVQVRDVIVEDIEGLVVGWFQYLP